MSALHGMEGLTLTRVADAVYKFGIGNVALALGGVALLVLIADYSWMIYMHYQMPPGPFPLPIVGNTHLLPENKPWIYFEQVAMDYKSPVITFWIGRNPTVWINDAWSANELFDKKAGIYSSRPRMLVFAELSGRSDKHLVSMKYGERWRLHRKITHQVVGTQKVREYRNFQNDESKVMAMEILQRPKEYVGHLERYATSVVSIIGFGRRVASEQDPIITEVIAVMHRAADLNVPGKHMPMVMESFPWMSKLPVLLNPALAAFKKSGRGMQFFLALAHEANQKTQTTPCVVKHILKEAPKHHLEDEEIASLTGNLFGAGSDTSSSTLITFVLACCAFPEVLPAAWAELDRVVGSSRSPHFDDEANLPYCRAFADEVLRWRSVAIIGGQPHAPVQDDRWNGYLIPKDSWVQGNVWAIHHNEKEFPDPDRFNPNRFIKGHEDSRPFPTEKGRMTFGWGRRVCSGQALAEQGTFISVARLLWAFNICKEKDAQGRDVPVDIFNYTNGLNMRPQPFPCRFLPRSEEIRQTILREGKQALEDLSIYDGETAYRMSTMYEKPQLGGWEKKIR
ncbi:putative cytochrome P450 [Elsinoe ampelina]|uniref:Putative cytochrome P450 n=1 Tax=Elsinoe ampelina TaxID=302913 RepID=A0A6A6G0D7_9PEZI|nr:putative cytochrome P450 [Elsinoe ampelina]